ncbi:hypothetical protein B0H11DRAFT_2279574 [Mycena galericulata]|nr:hypothetical protein B0H11DRAFT_2279574 [Mycena galericulata]
MHPVMHPVWAALAPSDARHLATFDPESAAASVRLTTVPSSPRAEWRSYGSSTSWTTSPRDSSRPCFTRASCAKSPGPSPHHAITPTCPLSFLALLRPLAAFDALLAYALPLTPASCSSPAAFLPSIALLRPLPLPLPLLPRRCVSLDAVASRAEAFSSLDLRDYVLTAPNNASPARRPPHSSFSSGSLSSSSGSCPASSFTPPPLPCSSARSPPPLPLRSSLRPSPFVSMSFLRRAQLLVPYGACVAYDKRGG